MNKTRWTLFNTIAIALLISLVACSRKGDPEAREILEDFVSTSRETLPLSTGDIAITDEYIDGETFVMELVINTSTEVVLQFKKEGVLGTIPQITQKLIKKAGYDICCIFTCNNGTAKLYVKNSEL